MAASTNHQENNTMTTATNQRLAEVREAIANGRITEAQPPRGPWAGAQVTYDLGCEEFVFRLGSDDAWRYVYHLTYGNLAMVRGPGCDASGYVIPDPEVCDALWAAIE